jgi:predicted transcriptional regulator
MYSSTGAGARRRNSHWGMKMRDGLRNLAAGLTAGSRGTPLRVMLQQLVDEHVLMGSRRCFLVTRGQDTVGLMTLHRIKEVPRREWTTTSVAEVMLPLEQSKRTEPDTELWTALQQMDRDGVNQLPVTRDNQVIGMLSREDVIAFLRTLQELRT